VLESSLTGSLLVVGKPLLVHPFVVGVPKLDRYCEDNSCSEGESRSLLRVADRYL